MAAAAMRPSPRVRRVRREGQGEGRGRYKRKAPVQPTESLAVLASRRFVLLGLDGLFGAGIDPPARDAETVFRRYLGMLEFVPVGNPEGGIVELRDHVIAVLQHAIERMRMGDQALPRRRRDEFLDQ